LVTSVGAATGSRAAAAALACAASAPDRAALLIDLADGRARRPTLVATAGARALEERLVAHLPEAAVASRGSICLLQPTGDPPGIEEVAAAAPLVRESACVVHLPPRLLRPVLADSRVRPTATLLRADLADDRALTALVARDLMRDGLRVSVLKLPLGWLAARAALLAALSSHGETLPARLCERLLVTEDKKLQRCYSERNGAKSDQGEFPPQAPQRPARSQRGQKAECPRAGQGPR
jgi:hypothetical protein